MFHDRGAEFSPIERGVESAEPIGTFQRYWPLRVSRLRSQKGEMLKRPCFVLDTAHRLHIELRQLFADGNPRLSSGQRECILPQFELLMAR